jgi:drug/metabolite transporter (DMT)-like permease
MRRLGWRRLALLSLCSGPLLGILNFEGYSLAPLSHGAVLAPAFSTLWGVVLAALILRVPQTRAQRAGLLLILLGLAVVGGVVGGTLHEHLGDLMFCMSGLLWGYYTVLLRMWQINGLIGAAIVGLCSSLPSFALFAASSDFEHLLAMPSGPFWTQAIFQSLFAGSLSVIAFGYAVQHLGASRAALFPATVPLLALSAGDLLFDAQVRPTQWIGLVVTTVGLMFALGLIRLRAATPLRVPAS